MRKGYTYLVPYRVAIWLMNIRRGLGTLFFKKQYRFGAFNIKNFTEELVNDAKFDKILQDYPNWTRKKLIKYYQECLVKYGAYPCDFYGIEFYNKSLQNVEEYVTTYYQWHNIVDYFNSDAEANQFFEDKVKFNETFSDLLGRGWLYITGETLAQEVCDFLAGKEKVVLKPARETCAGEGVVILYQESYDNMDKIERLINKAAETPYIIEEFIEQKGILHEINPQTVNSTRLTTIKTKNEVKVVFIVQKFGVGDSNVDNTHMGGIAFPVDIDNKCIVSCGKNSKGEKVIIHPYSKNKVIGLEIPNIDKAIEVVTEAAMRVENVRYIGWDVVISDDRICIIEGNHNGSVQDFEFPELKGKKELFVNIISKEK